MDRDQYERAKVVLSPLVAQCKARDAYHAGLVERVYLRADDNALAATLDRGTVCRKGGKVVRPSRTEVTLWARLALEAGADFHMHQYTDGTVLIGIRFGRPLSEVEIRVEEERRALEAAPPVMRTEVLL